MKRQETQSVWQWWRTCLDLSLKGTVHPKIKNTYFPSYLQCYSIDQSRLFWCELPSVGDIHVCLLSNIMELDDTLLVVLKAPKNTFEKLNSNVSF